MVQGLRFRTSNAGGPGLIPGQGTRSRMPQLRSSTGSFLFFVFFYKRSSRSFPGGSVVKNHPASSGDTGSIPDPGRSHMPQSNETCAPQLLSLCSGAQEPQLPKPEHPKAHAPQQEKPLQGEAWRAVMESSP